MGFLKHLFRGFQNGGHHSRGHHNKRGYGYREDSSDAKVMIRCTACGEKNEESAAFCKKCGSPLGKFKSKQNFVLIAVLNASINNNR